ncbi:MAG: T9SS type A sorting domain-containing protein [Bacteroidota bacterium]
MHRYLLTPILLLSFFATSAQSECVSCSVNPNQGRDWIGDESSDWNNPLNWENDVLPSGLDPIIDATIYINPPIIASASVFVPDDLIIENGGVLLVQDDLIIGDDFSVRSGGLLRVEGGNVESDDDFNLCAGGFIEISGGLLDNMPTLPGSGILRVCTAEPAGQPSPLITITGGALITTTTDTPDGTTIEDFLDVSGDGVYSDGDGTVILPVELVSFTGKAELDGVLLEWQTATEINNDRFEVHHSTDGQNFQVIGIVAGAGTTNAPRNYEFKDQNPASVNYYRLRQVDFDGTEEFFSIIKVDFTALRTASVAVYDREAQLIHVSSPDILADVVLYEPSGRMVFRASQVGKTEIATATLRPGLYLLRMANESIQSTHKLIIGR